MISSVMIAMLLSGAPANATAPAEKTGDVNKVVCRTTQVTGSIVKKQKACHSKRTSARLRESHQEQWSAIQGTAGSSRGN